MTANPFLGVVLHSIGGLAAGSFYVPYRGVKKWAWEIFWLAGGVFSWIIAPWVVALLSAPETLAILGDAPASSLIWTFVFGLLWGVGGLTFGLSMRYLGIALGYAVALGFCAAFGMLVPPIFRGEFRMLSSTASGLTVLAGVSVCLLGIAVSGMAGRSKEREMTGSKKQASVPEFNVAKGLTVAVFSGILSACMNYGIQAGKPIAKLAIDHGTPRLWQNTPVFVVILAGGFITNALWCGFLATRNRTWSHLGNTAAPLAPNYLLCALAGTTWYMQFMFYGMGTTMMERFDYSSWSLHMAAIIIFSTLWGIGLREWRGTGRRTHRLIAAGLALLILSMVVVGYGNYLDTLRPH